MSLIGKEDRVLELGGGLGAACAYISKVCRPSAYTVFEANPKIKELLLRTLKRNGLTEVSVRGEVLPRSRALLAYGNTDFYISEDFWISAIVPGSQTSKTCQVPVASFDKVVEDCRPSVVLCDIEGGELSLFDFVGFWDLAAARVLRRKPLQGIHCVIMEMHPAIIGESGLGRIRKSFDRLGFEEKIYTADGVYSVFARARKVTE